MCEILIKAEDHVHPDPVKDRRGAYKRGMPVVVMPDGQEWGKQECLPKFVILKLPGVPVEKALRYIMPDEIPDGFEEDGITPKTTIYRRRLWKFRFDDMPAAAKIKLRDQGELTIGPGGDYTWAQVRTYLRNLRTDQDETRDL